MVGTPNLFFLILIFGSSSRRDFCNVLFNF